MYYDVYLLKYPKSYYGVKFVKPDDRLIFTDLAVISTTKIGRVSEETPLKDFGFILDWQFHGDAQQSMIFGKTKRLDHFVRSLLNTYYETFSKTPVNPIHENLNAMLHRLITLYDLENPKFKFGN